MEARNKKIEDWFAMVKQGQVVLPRFQRHEAWRHAQVVGLLENILRDPPLPIGALLTLEVGDQELFHSRPIVGAPKPQSKPSMHLLDGQQRMTALWRSLTGDYRNDGIEVFISLNAKEDDGEGDNAEMFDAPKVEAIKRWDRKGVMQPVWANDPVSMFKEGYLPATILCPGSIGEEALTAWEDAIEESGLLTKQLTKRTEALRQRVAKYDVPFLSLSSKTGRDTALDVFIKMNTSATPLKDFDIVVAQLESATGDSLHDMVGELVESVPAARDYGRIEDMILSVAALLMDRPPLKKTYLDTAYGNDFASIWTRLKHGFKHGIAFLRSESILNEQCLPSEVAVYLTCALWADVPEHAFDDGGNARALIRKALWRGCYTNRYGKTSATRAYADYRVLRDMIAGKESGPCELFDETYFPLPAKEEMLLAGWPGRKDRLPRAMLATWIRRGGLDFADGASITPDNFHSREYHHLYPVGILSGDRADEKVNRALNCALITWTTNRKVGAQTPSGYISKRAVAASLGEEAVRQRLESHLIPYDALIADDYDAFLIARADRIHADMIQLCQGGVPA
ncbi:GmrSD restriction endonuclease domain-containing protein [Pseudonocardia sp. TMWB2A]|uniref:GmrSD restriction endonuclease domain-containing protein n=1 Tax=Pseudonocardia sp. TMWB2A TaxID=687430 RepID=UPI00307F7635